MSRITLILACEGTYQGLHGMNDYAVEEFEDDEYELACEQGREMSAQVIESYSSISDSLYDEDGEDYDEEVAEEIFDENIEYYLYRQRLDSKLTREEIDGIMEDYRYDIPEWPQFPLHFEEWSE